MLAVKYATVLLMMIAAAAFAGEEWPQFHGPNRNNVSTETGLMRNWPEGGPPRIHEVSGLGEGYSSVAIAGGRIYTTGAVEDACVITALDMTGEKLWTRKNGEAWGRSYPGTRSTPTIHDGLLYHLSGNGNMLCLEAESGETVWSLDLLEKFGGRYPTWGLAESPLVAGGKVYCTPGGETVSMAALDAATGESVWECRGIGDKPGYASPVLIAYKGLKQVVTAMQQSIVGVRADDGKLLWQYPHKVYADENITTPLFHDGYVIVSGCGRRGTTALKLAVSGGGCSVTERWRNPEFDIKQGGLVLLDSRLYGYAESQNRSKPWVCADFHTGETLFQAAPVISSYKYKNGCLTAADGMLYLLSDDGHMCLVKPLDDGFEVRGRLTLRNPGKNPTWAHPVVCGGRLYVRYGGRLGIYRVADASDPDQ
jgi:outer membrane protein assembly factor BamB